MDRPNLQWAKCDPQASAQRLIYELASPPSMLPVFTASPSPIFSPYLARMSTRRSSSSYSSPNPTRDPSVVSRSRSLFPYYPQQRTPPRHMLSCMALPDRTHSHLYNCGLSSPWSRFPPQPMLPIVANPHLYNHHHASRCEQSKAPQFLSGLVPQWQQHHREQASPLPTPPSNNSSWAYSLRSLGRLPTSSPRRWEPCAANMSWGASPSSTFPLPCSQLMSR